MDRERLDQWCEWGIFGLVLGMLVFAPLAIGGVGAIPFLVLQTMACGILFLWGIRLWANPTYRLIWPPLCWAVLAFVGYAIVRYRCADIEYVARQELIKVVVYAVVFFAVLNNLNRQDLSLALCVGLIIFASVESLYAIFQFATHSTVIRTVFPVSTFGSSLNIKESGSLIKFWTIEQPLMYKGRVGGSFVCPNHLAGYLGMILPAALALVVAGRLNHAFKVVLGYLAGLMLIAVVLTLSRGGFIAVSISLLVLLLILVTRRNYRISAILLLVALVWGGYYLATHNEGLGRRYKETYASMGSKDPRSMIWEGAWRMWQDNFWLGVGPGLFDSRYGQYRPVLVQQRPQFAHNDYINTLDDWGLVGALIIVVALALFYWGIAKTLPFVHRSGNALQAKKSNKPAIVLGGGVAILAMLIHAVTEFNMHIPANALLAVTWLGLVSSFLRFATESYWISLRWIGKSIATIVLILAFAFLNWQCVRGAATSHWLEIAQKQPFGPKRAESLKNALAIEPMNNDISFEIAENLLRSKLSWEDGYASQAREAMLFYEHGMTVNPWDPYNYIGYGSCLDGLGQSRRATSFFDRAVALDSNNSDVLYKRGWHALELGSDLEHLREARRWYGRSLLIEFYHIPMARTMYERILPVRIKEAETATNSKR